MNDLVPSTSETQLAQIDNPEMRYNKIRPLKAGAFTLENFDLREKGLNFQEKNCLSYDGSEISIAKGLRRAI